MRALWCAALIASGCSEPAPGWHVRGGALRAPDGRAAILRGVNLSGAQKSPPYLDDKTPADYTRIRADWGMNAIRFVMTWSAVEPDIGRYDDAYLDRVAERLGWAAQAGLLVVLDMHEDIYGEGFGFDGAPRWTCDPARYAAFVPRTPWWLGALDANVQACVDDFYTRADLQQHFIAAWRHVAERLGAQPAVIGFDVLNEPAWGTYPIFDFEQDRLTPLYTQVVTAVRAAAPGWVAFLEPSSSRNTGVATGLTAFAFRDVMYAPHSYDQSAEGGAGFDAAHRQTILDNVAALAAEARTLDAGLWIGEYGGDPSKPGIVEYMTAQYDAAGAAAGSTMYWAYDKSDGYGLLAPDGSEKTVLLDALVRPYPARVAGDPIAYGFDAVAATFTLTYAPDRSVRAPTEIVVPARAYPNGWHVECGGCAFEARGDVLAIVAPPSATPATIAVHP
jgi:endoglycosylceramidase